MAQILTPKLDFSDLIDSVRGNALLLIITGVLFYGIPTAAAGQWGVFYMQDLGLSKTQIGFVSITITSTSLLFLIIGGDLADSWGRKRTTVTIDIIAYTGGYLILALSRNFLYFMIYALVWGTSTASGVAFGCLFAESVEPEKRGKAYALNAIITPIPGVFMPYVGYLVIEHFQASLGAVPGLIMAMRLLYLWVSLSVAVGVLVRYLKVKETHPSPTTAGFLPRRYISAFTSFPPHIPRYVKHPALFKGYKDTVKWLWERRTPFTYWLASAISSFAGSLTALAYPFYIVDHLGLKLSALATFASVNTATGIALTIFLAPHFSTNNLKKYMLVGLSLSPVATLAFLMAKENIGLLILSGMLGSFAGAFAGPAGGGYWADLIPNERRAKVTAVTGVMTNIINVPSQFIGLMLYQIIPYLPWVFVIAFQISTVLLIASLPKIPTGNT
jgi:MFS family permease